MPEGLNRARQTRTKKESKCVRGIKGATGNGEVSGFTVFMDSCLLRKGKRGEDLRNAAKVRMTISKLTVLNMKTDLKLYFKKT
ncbi:MAG: hypothetical protein BGO76_03155 [Caedibacter sp. 38-128]|nr:MAG: hypothetical protein BGO76_03155 [Caedibacter sp. 38-128]